MKDTRQIIRELVEEVIEEMTATGAVAGYQTKFAFGKGDRTKKIAGKPMPGGTVVGKKESDDTSVEEGKEKEDESLPIVRRGAVVEEGRGRYYNFKQSDLMRNEAKINLAVREAKNMMKEINFLLNITERLKTECGIQNETMLKRTIPNLMEINRQLKEIAKRINRMGKQ